MPILAFLSNLGMGGGGSPKPVGGGEYGRVKKRRVLIGDKQLVLSEDQLRELLMQMAESEQEAPAKAPQSPPPVVAKRVEYPEFKSVPKFVPIARQMVRSNDLQTLALMREIARDIEMMRDEEDIAILLLH